MINWKSEQSLKGINVEREKAFAHPTCDGLLLRVYPNGTKVWRWKRALNNKPLNDTLGKFPAMGIAVAIDRARELNVAVDQGFDPLAKAGSIPQPAKRVTIDEAWTTYMADCVRRNRKSVHIRDLTGKKWIVGAIGTKFVADVTEEDVQRVVDGPLNSPSKGRTGGAVRSNGVLKICKTFGKFCKKRKIDGVRDNPAENIDPIPSASITGVRAKRRLSLRELALVILAARELDRRNGGTTAWADIMTLLVMNGCRKGEVFDALGDEWKGNLGLWVIGPERYKTSAECVLPVSTTSAEILSRRAETGSYIIPSQSGVRTGAYVYFRDKLWRIMEEIAGYAIPHWTFHDIRHGFRTNIRKERIASKEVAEKIIHPSPSTDIDELYDDDWLEEMREALTKWEDRVNREVAAVKLLSNTTSSKGGYPSTITDADDPTKHQVLRV